jgi:hypothetical protein
MEPAQQAMLTAIPVEIDIGDDTALAGWYVSPPADLQRARLSAILRSVRNNMKGGDPVSHCLFVAPFAVTWISDARVAV